MSSTGSSAHAGTLLRLEQRLGFALEPAERQIIVGVLEGSETSFGSSAVVRSKVVQCILLDEGCRKLLADVAFRLDNCTLAGDLDLRNANVTCALRFQRTTFTGGLLLSFSNLRSLIMKGCSIGEMHLNDAKLDGSLRFLPHEGVATQVKKLVSPRVRSSADIVFDAVQMGVPGDHEPACNLQRASLAGSLYFVGGTEVVGGLVADECQVSGSVTFIGSTAYSRTRYEAAVSFVRARIDGSVFLHSRAFSREPNPTGPEFTSSYGALRFDLARISGDMHLGGLQINPPDSSLPESLPSDEEAAKKIKDTAWWGLRLVAASVAGSIWLPKVIAIDTGVLFSHLRVGRDLACEVDPVVWTTGSGS